MLIATTTYGASWPNSYLARVHARGHRQNPNGEGEGGGRDGVARSPRAAVVEAMAAEIRVSDYLGSPPRPAGLQRKGPGGDCLSYTWQCASSVSRYVYRRLNIIQDTCFIWRKKGVILSYYMCEFFLMVNNFRKGNMEKGLIWALWLCTI